VGKQQTSNGLDLVLKKTAVYHKLQLVVDPELDEALTDLNFIKRIDIDDQNVTITFHLPTYWCSPNFAFIMAEDIKKRVEELDWVKRAEVILIDHLESKKISEGVSKGKTFKEVFGKSQGDLYELRQKFRLKAFYARQERLAKKLLNENVTKETIITMSIIELLYLSRTDKDIDQLVSRYLSIREEFDLSTESGAIAFTDPYGKKLAIDTFKEYFLNSKRERLSMEFNSTFCQGILQTRYKDIETNRNLLIDEMMNDLPR